MLVGELLPPVMEQAVVQLKPEPLGLRRFQYLSLAGVLAWHPPWIANVNMPLLRTKKQDNKGTINSSKLRNKVRPASEPELFGPMAKLAVRVAAAHESLLR